ncbi:MAG: AmmeMemoRadiSam system protein A [Sedimentisphaeraceae bacterium JB056]
MDPVIKKKLLDIVREAVKAAVCGKKYQIPRIDDPELLEHRGCFVTLKTEDRLRGCIGVFMSNKPLVELAVEMAYSSATDDPRFEFDRLVPQDMKDLQIEISVLSKLQKTNNPLSLELGKHGIYIKKGHQTGCFLPQVATETGWSKEEFLSYCCSHKAGLARHDWQEDDTDVYLFTAEIIK